MLDSTDRRDDTPDADNAWHETLRSVEGSQARTDIAQLLRHEIAPANFYDGEQLGPNHRQKRRIELTPDEAVLILPQHEDPTVSSIAGFRVENVSGDIIRIRSSSGARPLQKDLPGHTIRAHLQLQAGERSLTSFEVVRNVDGDDATDTPGYALLRIVDANPAIDALREITINRLDPQEILTPLAEIHPRFAEILDASGKLKNFPLYRHLKESLVRPAEHALEAAAVDPHVDAFALYETHLASMDFMRVCRHVDEVSMEFMAHARAHYEDMALSPEEMREPLAVDAVGAMMHDAGKCIEALAPSVERYRAELDRQGIPYEPTLFDRQGEKLLYLIFEEEHPLSEFPGGAELIKPLTIAAHAEAGYQFLLRRYFHTTARNRGIDTVVAPLADRINDIFAYTDDIRDRFIAYLYTQYRIPKAILNDLPLFALTEADEPRAIITALMARCARESRRQRFHERTDAFGLEFLDILHFGVRMREELNTYLTSCGIPATQLHTVRQHILRTEDVRERYFRAARDHHKPPYARQRRIRGTNEYLEDRRTDHIGGVDSNHAMATRKNCSGREGFQLTPVGRFVENILNETSQIGRSFVSAITRRARKEGTFADVMHLSMPIMPLSRMNIKNHPKGTAHLARTMITYLRTAGIPGLQEIDHESEQALAHELKQYLNRAIHDTSTPHIHLIADPTLRHIKLSYDGSQHSECAVIEREVTSSRPCISQELALLDRVFDHVKAEHGHKDRATVMQHFRSLLNTSARLAPAVRKKAEACPHACDGECRATIQACRLELNTALNTPPTFNTSRPPTVH